MVFCFVSLYHIDAVLSIILFSFLFTSGAMCDIMKKTSLLGTVGDACPYNKPEDTVRDACPDTITKKEPP